ncbi:MAG: PQQ-dependent sugar dehydrogenase [Actinomycetes bacterium]
MTTALLLAAAAALTACGPDGPDPSTAPAGAAPSVASNALTTPVSSVRDVRVQATKIGSVDGIPTALVGTPDGRQLLVARVTGQVEAVRLVQRGDVTVPTSVRGPVADVASLTRFDGQNRGLLGMAFVDRGRRLALSYTDLAGAVTVRTFPWSGRRVPDGAEGRVVISIPHPLAGLSGGGIAATQRGDVVLAIGDMDQKFTTPPSAQNFDSPLGSVLKIPAAELAKPSGPPMTFGPSQLLAKGLRNPWGISVDPVRSDVWLGDVGDASVEEFDRIPAARSGGIPNFGWPYLEGNRTRVEGAPASFAPTPPVFARPHAYEVCGAVGGAVYRGTNLPELYGAYVMGDLCSRRIEAMVVRGNRVRSRATIGRLDQKLVMYGTDQSGEIYALGVKGGIFRLDPEWWTVRPRSASIGTPNTTPATPPTTFDAERPPPQCGIQDVFLSLNSLSTTPRDRIPGIVANAERLMSNAAAGAPPRMRDDVLKFREALDKVIAVGRANDWDFTKPELQRTFEAAQGTTGEFAPYSDVINRLIEDLAACPGVGL